MSSTAAGKKQMRLKAGSRDGTLNQWLLALAVSPAPSSPYCFALIPFFDGTLSPGGFIAPVLKLT